SFSRVCVVGCFFFTHDAISQLDRLAAIRRLRMQHADIIAIVPVLNLFPFHWDIELFLGNSLKGIGLGQRYPDASIAFDLRKFHPVDALELIRAFNDAWIVSSASRNCDCQEKYQSCYPHFGSGKADAASSPHAG